VSSLRAQADQYACLLDELGIEKVAVIAVSAGGPSGMQFAASYPERLSHLVLFSAMSYTEKLSESELRQTAWINRLVASDPVYWLGITFAPHQAISLLGVTEEVQSNMTPAEIELKDRVMESMLPMGPRLPGIRLDQARDISAEVQPENIRTPTLVLHSKDDTLIDLSHGKHSAQVIPGARLVEFDNGGHFLVNHTSEIQQLVHEFFTTFRP
jgi:pimeloyl-ACP methyl ester carboxylesterase